MGGNVGPQLSKIPKGLWKKILKGKAFGVDDPT